MDLQELDVIDTEKMYRVYDRWYEIAKKSYEQDFSRPNFKDIDHVVFVGMGGSGTIGDIFSSILSKKNIHTTVVKGYLLPETVDSNTLIVVTSISGNTDETLTVLENSLKTEARIIAMSSGGKMEDIVSENKNILYFKIDKIHSPRASLFAFLYSTLNILKELIPIEKSDVLESLDKLEILQKQISSINLTEKNPALELAKWIDGVPIIYYPAGLGSVAIRFKNSLQENAKSHVITEDIIEACHNGVVPWEKKQMIQPILIQGIDDNIKTKERWKILEEFFATKNIPFYKISSVDGSIISKITNLIYILDYASIYHAILHEVDPSPVSSIDYIKKRL